MMRVVDQYIVAPDNRILHDGRNYGAGDIILLSQQQADQIGHAIISAPLEVKPSVADKDDAPAVGGQAPAVGDLVAAIAALDPGTPDHWQKDGKPKVKALAVVLNREVTAAERDDAWAVVKGP